MVASCSLDHGSAAASLLRQGTVRLPGLLHQSWECGNVVVPFDQRRNWANPREGMLEQPPPDVGYRSATSIDQEAIPGIILVLGKTREMELAYMLDGKGFEIGFGIV